MAAPAIHTRGDIASGRRLESLSFLSLSPAVPDRTDLIHGAVHSRNAHFEALLYYFFFQKGKEKKRGKEGKIICSADYIIACQDAVSFSSLFPRLILTCCGNLSHSPFIVGAERQPSPVEKKHIKRSSQVFPMAGGEGGGRA